MYVTYLYYVNKIIYCMIALMFSLSQMNPVTLFASIGLYICAFDLSKHATSWTII